MELFDKIYGCYYQVVRQILAEAAKQPVTQNKMEAIACQYGYQESALAIIPKLTEGDWSLMRPGPEHTWSPVLAHQVKQPLTNLQKSWLKALLADERIRLFFTDQEVESLEAEFRDTAPLFSQEDFYYFDRYRDGDPYESPEYRQHFRTILNALAENRPLLVSYKNRRDVPVLYEVAPYQLQYSSKDDKFRLCCLQHSHHSFSRSMILNLARIQACHISRKQAPKNLETFRFQAIQKSKEPVVIEISGERNSLERCMLHFANYEKHTEYMAEKAVYVCSIYYDLADETELLIDILSFGPVIRVLGPESFLQQIKQRVKRQHELFYGNLP